jgi:hypothetical protein
MCGCEQSHEITDRGEGGVFEVSTITAAGPRNLCHVV